MMKNPLIPLLLVLALAVSLSACGAKPAAPAPEPVPEAAPESAPEPVPEAAPEPENTPDAAPAAPSDPNAGVYRATLVEMYGVGIDPGEIYPEGFVIELGDGGKCAIIAGDTRGEGVWSLEGETLTVDDGASTITGTLSDGVITLINMLDTGLDITLVKQE